MEIRPVRYSDADALAAVHVASWHEAYPGLLPEPVLAAFTLERRSARWRRMLSEPHHGIRLLAEDGRGPFGFCVCEGPDRQGTGELAALYLHPRGHGRGAGSALLSAGLEWLWAAGAEAVGLWVLEANLRARRFYERHLFAPTGRWQEQPFLGAREVRYRREKAVAMLPARAGEVSGTRPTA